MKIYLAGPLGFSEPGGSFLNKVLVPLLREHGYQPLNPFALTDPATIDAVLSMPYGQKRRDAWRQLNTVIAGNNRRAIDDCDLVLAILDGLDVDSGTAAEIGYAFAKHKPILGYRSDVRPCGDNEGATVNLQVEYFIRGTGGEIVTSVTQLPAALTKLLKAHNP
jgi:nucleoside 2-deoxyribosyltransferase